MTAKIWKIKIIQCMYIIWTYWTRIWYNTVLGSIYLKN